MFQRTIKDGGLDIGVFYVTAVATPGSDASDVSVRIVMTLDVESGQATTRHAHGVIDACQELRAWMIALCAGPAREQ